MNILLIDELPIYIKGMNVELKRVMPDCHIISTSSLVEAEKILLSSPVSVILLDGELECLDFMQSLASLHSEIPVVVMLRKTRDDGFNEYLRQNVKGILLKEQSVEEMSQVLNMVMSGVVCFPNRVVVSAGKEEQGRKLFLLSRRQQEILKLLANGGTNKQIGRQLNISAGTVKVHLESIFNRLQVHNRTQAASLYFRYISHH
jgi:DNA-binding NarL/FixJ family response regulator